MILKRGLIESAGMALIMTASAQAAGDEKVVSKFSINASRATRSRRARMGSARPCTGFLAAKAGTVLGYNYSAAMKNSGVVWNEDTLKQYLADPHKFIPGEKMIFAGIKNEEKLDDLIVYLRQATQ